MTERASVALRFLSSYLGMELLHEEINNHVKSRCFLPHSYNYIGKEIFESLAYSWKESVAYHDEKILKPLTRKANQLLNSELSFVDYVLEKFLSFVPLELIARVWESSWFSPFLNEFPKENERVNILVEALWKGRLKIDDRVIAFVTCQSSLPELTTSSAKKLLKMVSNQSEWTKGSDEIDAMMNDLERRCIEALSEDWVKALDVETTYQDLKDDDQPKKKRQKLESSCSQFSAEIERNLLKSTVVKASYDLAVETRRSLDWLNEYIDLGQSVQSYEGAMTSQKNHLYVFGNSGASGCYQLYGNSMENKPGIEKQYTKQSRFQYDSYGHTDDRTNRSQCTLQYNKTKSCWQISVSYREREDEPEEVDFNRDVKHYKKGNIDKVLFESPRKGDSTDIPKVGWKYAITGEDRPGILALDFETLRQAYNPSYAYPNDEPYDGIFRL